MEGEVSLQLPDGSAALSPSVRARAEQGEDEFAEAVLAGFASTPRSIPCRFFYDAVGSELFEEIAKLEEYYPTRVEAALLETYRAEIAALVGPSRVLIEFGSGSSRKTSLLIGALGKIPAYIPIDIAAESLNEAAGWLSEQHPGLNILPLIADFTKTRALPQIARRRKKARLLLGLDHRQFDPQRGARLPRQCGAAPRQRQRLPDRRRPQETAVDPHPRL